MFDGLTSSVASWAPRVRGQVQQRQQQPLADAVAPPGSPRREGGHVGLVDEQPHPAKPTISSPQRATM